MPAYLACAEQRKQLSDCLGHAAQLLAKTQSSRLGPIWPRIRRMFIWPSFLTPGPAAQRTAVVLAEAPVLRKTSDC